MPDFKYKATARQLSTPGTCAFCGAKITADEYAYEDYFVIFRGHTPTAFSGLMCFACWENKVEKR